MEQNRKHIFSITLCTAIASLLLFSVAVVKGWFGPEGGIGDVFCEASRTGYIKQPANTFSNFGFIFSGLLIAWQLSSGRFHQNNNSFSGNIFYGTFYSCLVVLLGPGSMALHATTAKVGGFFRYAVHVHDCGIRGCVCRPALFFMEALSIYCRLRNYPVRLPVGEFSGL